MPVIANNDRCYFKAIKNINKQIAKYIPSCYIFLQLFWINNFDYCKNFKRVK